jgi:hypothetical protein
VESESRERDGNTRNCMVTRDEESSAGMDISSLLLRAGGISEAQSTDFSEDGCSRTWEKNWVQFSISR